MGSVSGLVALALGSLFGRAYDGTVLPLVAGFTTAALLALVATELAEGGAEPALAVDPASLPLPVAEVEAVRAE
jgi:hypothetical protein